MAGILFEDIFDVKDIDPDGKKFDRAVNMREVKVGGSGESLQRLYPDLIWPEGCTGDGSTPQPALAVTPPTSDGRQRTPPHV